MDVLIADDERIIREGLADSLDWAAMECRLVGIAVDGIEALELYRVLRPDCVVTDIRMPRMNGLDLIKAIRSIDSSCRFIILSGHDEFEFARSAMRYGVNDYLLKPFEEEELAEVLLRIRNELGYRLTESTGHKDIDRILSYIHSHFRRRDLTLTWISENLIYLNTDYLGKLFREKVGVSFNTKLTGIRIGRARSIMTGNPDITIPELADAVGFPPDGSYLSTQFKRICGMTIGEFRKMDRPKPEI